MKTAWILAAALLWGGCADLSESDSAPFEATYQVTFSGHWSVENHPGAYPANAHFSPLVGAVHSSQVSFWELGGLASEGIEQMAELGATGSFSGEAAEAVSEGTALSGYLGQGLASGVASTTLTIKLNKDHSQATLVSMLAPSPDWFVGVSGLDLRPHGDWLSETSVALYPLDSGTDAGGQFTSGDADQNPALTIQTLGTPFTGAQPVARLTFTKQ